MEKMKLTTPVVLVVFNRLDCTKDVLDKIKKAKPSKLYLISDGAREDREGEDLKVQSVREYVLSNIDWDCEIHTNFSEENMGSKYRIYSGLNWVFETEDRAIILEDDCVPNDDFFFFCQEMLDFYNENDNIWVIGGTNLIRKQSTSEPYIFVRFPDTWGWATWRRAWSKCDIEMIFWESAKKTGALKYAYDFWSYRCLLRVIDHQIRLKRDAWDIPWICSMLYNNAVGIEPRENLVRNIGCGHVDASNTIEEVDYDFSYGEQIEFPMKKRDIVIDRLYDKEYLKHRWGWKKEYQYIK